MREEVEYLLSELTTRLDSLLDALGGRETHDYRTQLECISRAIQEMEREGVPISEGMLEIRNGLEKQLKQPLEAEALIEFLGASLDELVSRVNQVRKPSVPRRRRRRSSTPAGGAKRTPIKQLEELILQCLRAKGGWAPRRQVMAWVEKRMQGRFLPGDLESYGDGKLIWKTRLSSARRQLVQAGALKEAPRGIWALPEAVVPAQPDGQPRSGQL